MVSDLYREDAIGNFVLGLHSLFEEKGILSAVYAERNGKNITTNGTYTDFLSHVRSEDVLFYQLSNIDRRFNELMDSECRKIVYYHNITPGHYFAPYLPDVAKRLDLGRKQFVRLNEVDAILANSEYSLAEVTPFATEHTHIKAIPPVLPKIVERLQFPTIPTFPSFLPDNAPYLIMIGRITPHKRYEDAVHIFTRLRQHIPEMHLIMAGSWCDPYVKKLKKDIKNCNETAGFIHLTNHISTKALQSALHFAQGLFCTSAHEGFGVPILEAMALNRPVFAHKQPAVQELLDGTGVTFDASNPEKAAELIANILDSRDSLATIKTRQRRRYETIITSADGCKVLEALKAIKPENSNKVPSSVERL